MHLTLDGLMIKEMQQSYMVFELWKHVIHTQKQCSPSPASREDFWMGASMVPCILLISRKEGLQIANHLMKFVPNEEDDQLFFIQLYDA
jgi:hypothetical protein